jgi:hypothetical protein
MRGADVFQESLFRVRKLDDFVPAGLPLRPVREQVNLALERLNGLFAKMCAVDDRGGRASPPSSRCGRCCCGVLQRTLGTAVDGVDPERASNPGRR